MIIITSTAAYFELTFQQIVITKAAKHIKPQLNKQRQKKKPGNDKESQNVKGISSLSKRTGGYGVYRGLDDLKRQKVH